jgi:ferredoxin
VRVFVDSAVCRGHGQCEAVAPEVFQLTRWGRVVVSQLPLTEELRPKIAEAARLCPEGAISLID